MQISYAFQEPSLLPWKTVEENLHFVLKGQIPQPERQQVIDSFLNLTAMTQYKNYYPSALSGGMKQRLSLCRAFVFPHKLLVYSKKPTVVKAELIINTSHQDRDLSSDNLAQIYGQVMATLQREY